MSYILVISHDLDVTKTEHVTYLVGQVSDQFVATTYCPHLVCTAGSRKAASDSRKAASDSRKAASDSRKEGKAVVVRTVQATVA